jgi:hypothetical protein
LQVPGINPAAAKFPLSSIVTVEGSEVGLQQLSHIGRQQVNLS